MYWNRRVTDKEYIVVKHPLRDSSNTYYHGIKFTRGYAVVAKGSKSHTFIKSAPFLKHHKEFDLSYLKNIFRLKEVKLIFGHDVYHHYLQSIGLNDNGSPTEKTEEKPQEEQITEEKESVIETTEVEAMPEVPALCEEDSPQPVLEKEEEAVDLESLTPEQRAEAHKTLGLCSYIRKKDGKVCDNRALNSSPSGYCFAHVRFDPERRKK